MNKIIRGNTKVRKSVLLLSAAVIVAFGISMLISGCTGQTGSTGAAGPPGGGDLASINVTSFSIPTTSWVANGSPVITNYYFQSTFDSIADTKNVIVNVYFYDSVGHPNPTTWTALPYSRVDLFHNLYVLDTAKSDTVDELSYSWQQGSITINYSFLGPISSIQPKRSVFLYATAIPLAVMHKHPDINWKDPASVLALPQVQEALNKAKHTTESKAAAQR